MKFYVDGLVDEKGTPIVPPDGVVSVLAMHNRKVLPVADLKKDQQIKVNLTPWSKVKKTYGRVQAGTLPDVALELQKQEYWGEIPGQPSLTKEELAKVGEEDSPAQRTAPAQSR